MGTLTFKSDFSTERVYGWDLINKTNFNETTGPDNYLDVCYANKWAEFIPTGTASGATFINETNYEYINPEYIYKVYYKPFKITDRKTSEDDSTKYDNNIYLKFNDIGFFLNFNYGSGGNRNDIVFSSDNFINQFNGLNIPEKNYNFIVEEGFNAYASPSTSGSYNGNEWIYQIIPYNTMRGSDGYKAYPESNYFTVNSSISVTFGSNVYNCGVISRPMVWLRQWSKSGVVAPNTQDGVITFEAGAVYGGGNSDYPDGAFLVFDLIGPISYD